MPVYFYDTYEKPYGCFTNFSRHGFELDGDWWRTSEHYFQAQKFVNTPHAEEIRKLLKPREAFNLAHQLKHLIRPDWLEVRDAIMRKALYRKFQFNPEIKSVLLSTGNALLIENSPTDSYWGCGADGNGKNMLGKLLMEVRNKLRLFEHPNIQAAETSETVPLGVDFISSEVLGNVGRIGMTLAPGKKHPGTYGLWHRDLAQDLVYLRKYYNTECLVSLLEEHEFYTLQISHIFTEAELIGIDLNWFPIKDCSVPNSLEKFAILIENIISQKQQDKTIVIHCKAGLGRTGLVAACCLVYLGYSPPNAISLIRKTRSGTIQTKKQEEYIFDYAKFINLSG